MPPGRSPRFPPGTGRAIAPLVGALALLAITVVLATVVAVGLGYLDVAESPPVASLDLTVDAGDGTVEIEHVAGDTLDVDELTVTVIVEGESLAYQPPVPFFATNGFVSGPTGPFNEAADPKWTAGETASFRIATTNSPTMGSGDEVVVTVATDAGTVARLETTAA